jgi:hypothetical protein
MSEKSNDIISSSLGIGNEVEIIEPKREVIINTPHEFNDADADYNLSRRTFRSLIEKGNAAMENLTDLAKESESPRAYEVLATTMKTIADITKDLYDLQKKNQDLRGTKKEDKTNVTVEKAVFVGTTADLLKQMKEKKNENI